MEDTFTFIPFVLVLASIVRRAAGLGRWMHVPRAPLQRYEHARARYLIRPTRHNKARAGTAKAAMNHVKSRKI